MLHSRVETTDSTLSSESHHVRGSLTVPVLMSPVLATCTHASFCLIHNENDSVVFGHSLNFFVKSGSCHLVFVRAYGFDDDGTNRSLLLGNQILDLLNAPVFLLEIPFFILSEWILELWEIGVWPVVGWQILGV